MKIISPALLLVACAANAGELSVDARLKALENQAILRVATDPPAGAFTLIIVTHGADVRHSRGYATLRMCEQAKSIATHGMTLEQKAEMDAAAAKADEERKAEWRKTHPPRRPTAEERKWFTPAGLGMSCGRVCISMNADGMIEESPGIQSSVAMSGPSRDSIKHAECVRENGGKP